jgi:methyl-accepting chemotaxis protein
LFELAPEAKSLFGFSQDEDIKKNKKFGVHAKAMVDMIDAAVAFLGPDLDPLTDHLFDLGKRHVRYGVKADYLSMMGRSVIYALEQQLGAKFTLEDVKDWTMVFRLMVSKMILGMKG